MLAGLCVAGLADISTQPGELDGMVWPYVAVATDYPVAACLFSQYAGWKISVGKYFAMGSGPMRSVAATEELFDKLWYREETEQVVGVLEAATLPGREVFEYIAEKTGVEPDDVTLAVAPTSSMAGNYQVVARSVETAMHKLYELGFDVNRVRSAIGVAPLPPSPTTTSRGSDSPTTPSSTAAASPCGSTATTKPSPPSLREFPPAARRPTAVRSRKSSKLSAGTSTTSTPCSSARRKSCCRTWTPAAFTGPAGSIRKS